MKTAVMRAEAVPPEAPRGQPETIHGLHGLHGKAQGSVQPPGAGGHTASGPPKMAKSPPIWAAAAGGGAIILPLNHRGRFTKRTQMMAPVKTEKRRFPVENVSFDVQGWGNQKGFLRNEPK